MKKNKIQNITGRFIVKIFLGSIFVSITALFMIFNASALGNMEVPNSITAASQGYNNVDETSTIASYLVSFAWNNLDTNNSITLGKKLQIRILDPTNNQVSSISPITVTGNVFDTIDVDSVSVRVGSGPWVLADGIESWTVSSVYLDPGSNIITARVNYTSGNFDETSVTITYSPPDNQVPVIMITSQTNGQILYNSPITVGGTASDNVELSLVEVKIGSDPWQTATGTTSWTVSSIPLMAGSNTITARANDTSGNSEETSVTVTYTPPDNQNPVIMITSQTNDQILSTSPITVSGIASDNMELSKVEVKIGSDPWQLATGTTSWTISSMPLMAGSNTITARANDTSGNSEETSVTVTYTPPDNQNPAIMITSQTNDQILSTSPITVSGTASDNVELSKVEVKIGSDPWQLATGTTSWTVSSIPLIAGSNTITARANDTSGNSEETSVTVTYTPPDSQNPVIMITSQTNDQVLSTSPITVSGTASDNVELSKVEVKIGSDPWQTAIGTTSWTVSSIQLLAGSNMIKARANDTSGNSNETSITVTYTPPDSQYPVIFITSHTNDQILSSSPITVSGTASDNGSLKKVEVKIGSGPWQTAKGTTSWKVPTVNLLAGSNMITARVNDTSGNSNETSILVIYNPVIKVKLDINSATNRIKTTVNAKSASGNAFITIPKGTLAKDVDGNLLESLNIISITNLPVNVKISENDRLIGELVGLEPEGAYFDPPIQIGFNYAEPLPANVNEDSLSVRFFDTSINNWKTLPIFIINKTQNYLIANISHFSIYTLIGTASTSTGSGNTNKETSSSGGGGGGGGGGGSGEKYTNIDVNEKYDLSIYKDKMTSYRFTSPKNPIVGVNIIGNTNSDLITTMVESLKNTSTLVSLAPPGIVYRNVNIWVGTSGFATPRNIKEAFVKFRVDNNWLSAKSFTGNDIVLVKWNGTGWIMLETRVLSNDGENTFFEGKTNAFSSFAITTKVAGVKPATVSDNEIFQNAVEKTLDKLLPNVVETANITKITVPVSSKWSMIFILFIVNIIIITLYFKYMKN